MRAVADEVSTTTRAVYSVFGSKEGLVDALAQITKLQAKIRRVEEAGLLGRTSVRDATIAFEAMMEGLANAEFHGRTLPILRHGEEEHAWHRALASLFRGFLARGEH